ncbi:uncharacterized protein LOC110036686 [Phalaenopsis equestris]|uniref:uncharacterized protein LOC110036686 n=1 Tax=Phalaenopsis equestris TaxID=78828 RepID=UPI0009E392DF|nr:uncharacterized protein LOC110036686 [Phalaenopsis equestris]
MGKKDIIASKKKPIYEASKKSSNSRLMENLKTANACLVKEAMQCRQEVKRLHIQLTSQVVEKDIFHDIQNDVFALVASSSLRETASRATAEMAVASDREKILREKIETVATEVDAEKIELLALTKEKDEREKELVELKESIGSMEQPNEHGRRRRNLFRRVAVAAPFIAAAGAVAVAFCIFLKK